MINYQLGCLVALGSEISSAIPQRLAWAHLPHLDTRAEEPQEARSPREAGRPAQAGRAHGARSRECSPPLALPSPRLRVMQQCSAVGDLRVAWAEPGRVTHGDACAGPATNENYYNCVNCLNISDIYPTLPNISFISLLSSMLATMDVKINQSL